MSKQAAQNTTNQITEGVIWKQLLIFFFPILFGTFFQQLYNTADAIIVGNFVGKEALASVGGSASTIINLLVGFFVGLSSGATVIISQYYGADNRRRVSDSVHTAIALAIAGGIVIMLLGLVSARFALTAMGTPDDILSLSLTYMKIYYLGTIPSMIYNMGSGILRAVGDSKRPLYFLIASCLVNIVLDLLFVAVLGMGVTGAAIATIASQFFSAILTLIALLRTQDSYRLIVSKIRFHRDLLFDIIKIGLPAGLQSAMYSISNLLIQSSINSFGSVIVAGNSAASNLEGFIYTGMNAFAQAAVTFTSQNIGARRYDNLDRVMRNCLLCAVGVGAVLGGGAYLCGESLLHFYSSDPAVIAAGLARMEIICTFYFVCGCMDTLASGLRGRGYSVLPMVVSLVGSCLLRVVWVATIFQTFHTTTVLYLSYPVSWALTAAAHLVCLLVVRRKTQQQLEAGTL